MKFGALKPEKPADKPGFVGLADESDEPESDSDDAASDVLAAIKASDAKALGLALQRHYEACAGSHDEDTSDPEA